MLSYRKPRKPENNNSEQTSRLALIASLKINKVGSKESGLTGDQICSV